MSWNAILTFIRVYSAERFNWSFLAMLGKSKLAQATILTPFIGQFIIYGADLEILQKYFDYTNLNWLYWSLLLICGAQASFLLLCPSNIKLYPHKSEYIDKIGNSISQLQEDKLFARNLSQDVKDRIVDLGEEFCGERSPHAGELLSRMNIDQRSTMKNLFFDTNNLRRGSTNREECNIIIENSILNSINTFQHVIRGAKVTALIDWIAIGMLIEADLEFQKEKKLIENKEPIFKDSINLIRLRISDKFRIDHIENLYNIENNQYRIIIYLTTLLYFSGSLYFAINTPQIIFRAISSGISAM